MVVTVYRSMMTPKEGEFMGSQSFKNLDLAGKRVAHALDAVVLSEKNGFIVEKRNMNKNIYIRINLVHNFVTEQSILTVERGTLSDKKPHVKEIVKDVDNLCVTIPESTEDVAKDMVTFLYIHGERFSIFNVDAGMIFSRLRGFDQRKLQDGKKVSKEVAEQRRQFTKIL